ncbi:MAG: hypothetical protein GX787_04005 [Tissierellia bacterium]|nr:hypothetical protein [Tissierellia bacterium]
MKSKIRSILFAIIILGLSVINVTRPTKVFSSKENRYLQQFPELTLSNIFSGDFSTDFEKYASDQFIGRDNWIGLKTLSQLAMLKKDNGRVYFGKDDYLFDVESGLDEKQFNENIQNLDKFVGSIGEKIKITALLVPTKTGVLEDKLPAYAPVIDEENLVAQIKEKLNKDIIVTDLINTFKEHANEDIYYKTDHHWTSKGAFYAYEKYIESLGGSPLIERDFIIDLVSDEFYGTSYRKANFYLGKPDTIHKYTGKNPIDYEIHFNSSPESGDLYDNSFLYKTDKYSYFLGGDKALVEINTSIKNGKTIVVLKDSFGNSMIPFLIHNYEKIIMLDTRYYNGSISDFVDENSVDEVLFLYNIQTFVSEKSFLKFKI